jgi:hypothetical protein
VSVGATPAPSSLPHPHPHPAPKLHRQRQPVAASMAAMHPPPMYHPYMTRGSGGPPPPFNPFPHFAPPMYDPREPYS